MVDVNYENLPAPRGFTIDLEDLELWDYVPDPEEHDGPIPRLNFAFRSGSLDVVYVTLPPGTKLPWHTHEPHTAQVYWPLKGTFRTKFKDNDGEVHSIDGSPEEDKLIYLPAGAHNQLENPTDDPVELLSFKEGGGAVVGRLEQILGDTGKHYDPKAIPAAGLEFLPRHGEILDMQEDAVEEW